MKSKVDMQRPLRG